MTDQKAASSSRLDARQLAHFGRRLRALRISGGPRKISQRELARLTGLSPRTIGELESGLHEPRLGTMLVLAEGLQLSSIEELLGEMPWQSFVQIPDDQDVEQTHE